MRKHAPKRVEGVCAEGREGKDTVAIEAEGERCTELSLEVLLPPFLHGKTTGRGNLGSVE